MSNANLSALASQKLQQIHQLVLQFQALESDLRDTFEEIEQNHQNEVKRLQREVNKLKGIDEPEKNDNPLFGATKLKQNPLSANQHNGMNGYSQSPQTPNSNNNGAPPMTYSNSYNAQSKQGLNNHSSYNGSSQQNGPNPRASTGSIVNNFNQPPPPIAPQQQSHWKNKTQISYNQQQRNTGYSQARTGYHAKPSSTGTGVYPPPPNNGYGQKKQLPPSPQKNGNGSNDKNDNNSNSHAKSGRLPDSPQKQRPKNPVAGLMSKWANNQNKEQFSTLDGLGNGISERDFYKKYWIEAGKIGEGAFARIRKITRKSDKAVFALKMIKKKGKSSEDIAALQREILVLQKCDHENIVRLGDWCDTKKRIYMVVEFCDGGDVFERVVQYKKFSEKSAIHVVQQVASGIGHVHKLGFVHRDLKPDNLMYLTKAMDSKIKIIDFGLAGDCNDAPCKTPCGTAHYAAPEVLSSLEYNQSADMWSLGVIIYTLLCGFPPFFDASNNMKNLYHLIKKGQYSFPQPFWDDISENAKDLIRKLLVKDPSKRLTANQVLQHPWIINANQAPDKDLGNQYVKQMSHWQSTRQATEFGLGQEAPPPPPPDQPINLYYQNGGGGADHQQQQQQNDQ